MRGRGGEVQREGVPKEVFSEVSFSEEERRVSGRKGIFRERGFGKTQANMCVFPLGRMLFYLGEV